MSSFAFKREERVAMLGQALLAVATIRPTKYPKAKDAPVAKSIENLSHGVAVWASLLVRDLERVEQDRLDYAEKHGESSRGGGDVAPF